MAHVQSHDPAALEPSPGVASIILEWLSPSDSQACCGTSAILSFQGRGQDRHLSLLLSFSRWPPADARPEKERVLWSPREGPQRLDFEAPLFSLFPIECSPHQLLTARAFWLSPRAP